MYAVIFRATVDVLDDEYFVMAKRMRELAMSEYGCTNFVAVNEDAEEIAISYWDKKEDIERWKQNSEHLLAQEMGQSKWYKSYSVEVVEIMRSYDGNMKGLDL